MDCQSLYRPGQILLHRQTVKNRTRHCDYRLHWRRGDRIVVVHGPALTTGQALAVVMAGGIIEHLQGGKFGHGFVSAGLSKAAMPAINTNNTYAGHANATFLPTDGRAFRAWAVAHEFGHLNSFYGPAGTLLKTENRANAFARKMTPLMEKSTGSTINITYGSD